MKLEIYYGRKEPLKAIGKNQQNSVTRDVSSVTRKRRGEDMKTIKQIESTMERRKVYIKTILKKDTSKGYSLTREEQRAINDACGKVTNNDIARVELHYWHKDKPKKYMAYLKGKTLTNWTGLFLGHVTHIKSRKKVYNSPMSNERIYFDAMGNNGVKYYGIGYGDGMYCRLVAFKQQ